LHPLSDGCVDEALLKHIKDKVELLNADGVSDEHTRMARTLWPEPGTNHMPHLKGTVEDLFSKDLRTLRPQWTRGAPHHESRRIKKRPWNADPVLSDLLERNILGGGS